MEWVDGHTLSDMIAAKQLKLADVLKYAIQAADALAQPARWAIYYAVGTEDGGVRKASFTEGTDVTAQFNGRLAALVKDGVWGGRLLLPQGGPFYLTDTIRFLQSPDKKCSVRGRA
jgi:hypothetical protein